MQTNKPADNQQTGRRYRLLPHLIGLVLSLSNVTLAAEPGSPTGIGAVDSSPATAADIAASAANGAADGTASEPAATGSPANKETATESQPDSSTTPDSRAQAQPLADRNRDLARQYEQMQEAEQVVWLDSGPAAESRYLGLFLWQTTRQPQGGVLILHAQGEHPDYPIVVNPLRETLPDYGWSTLSLALPNPHPKPLPKRQHYPTTNNNPADTQTTEDETSAGTSNQSNEVKQANASAMSVALEMEEFDYLALEQQINARIDAGIKYLNSKGQFNLVLVAEGVAATWAAKFIMERFPKTEDEGQDAANEKGMTLVLINAREPKHQPKLQLPNLIAEVKYPVLDLYLSESQQVAKQAKKRRAAMARIQHENYQQLKMPNISTPIFAYNNYLAKRVRGWLKANAAGQEVDIEKN